MTRKKLIMNPETGRFVTEGGTLHRRLIRRGVIKSDYVKVPNKIIRDKKKLIGKKPKGKKTRGKKEEELIRLIKQYQQLQKLRNKKIKDKKDYSSESESESESYSD